MKPVFERLTKEHRAAFGGSGALRNFSAPGRTELGGNHTDHNHGKVLAAAVQLEAAAVAEPLDGRIELRSKGWDKPFAVDLSDLSLRPDERGTSEALLRGVAYQFQQRGYRWGGFRATVESTVLAGSGLSSSAAFEVLAGSILNSLYNGGKLPPPEIAVIGQAAENLHFGKPCGLMDQMSSAVGGIVAIDFGKRPVFEKLEVDFAEHGWSLCIVNTRGDHADLIEEYASIPGEMKAVAAQFGQDVLREVDEAEFYRQLPKLVRGLSHRAVLRAIHFFGENRRVDAMVAALKEGKLNTYLDLVNESGRSSAEILQNVYTPRHPETQPISLALALTERFIEGEGACRVHGGGFAGTIQAYIPWRRREEYAKTMDAVFGAGSVVELQVRPQTAGEES